MTLIPLEASGVLSSAGHIFQFLSVPPPPFLHYLMTPPVHHNRNHLHRIQTLNITTAIHTTEMNFRTFLWLLIKNFRTLNCQQKLQWIQIVTVTHTMTVLPAIFYADLQLNTVITEYKPLHLVLFKLLTTRMWANAQRDGRPAKYRIRANPNPLTLQSDKYQYGTCVAVLSFVHEYNSHTMNLLWI